MVVQIDYKLDTLVNMVLITSITEYKLDTSCNIRTYLYITFISHLLQIFI